MQKAVLVNNTFDKLKFYYAVKLVEVFDYPMSVVDLGGARGAIAPLDT